jgi:hypothetical protein
MEVAYLQVAGNCSKHRNHNLSTRKINRERLMLSFFMLSYSCVTWHTNDFSLLFIYQENKQPLAH